MNLFENKSLYDAKLKNWVEFFYVNGQEISSDEYFELLDLEKEIADEKVHDCDCCCDSCECEYETIDELLDEYTEMICDTGLCCPHCVKEVLTELVAEILEGMDRVG